MGMSQISQTPFVFTHTKKETYLEKVDVIMSVIDRYGWTLPLSMLKMSLIYLLQVITTSHVPCASVSGYVSTSKTVRSKTVRQ